MDLLLAVIWTVCLWGAIFSILWWGKGQIGPKLSPPFADILHWILVAGIVCVSIGIIVGKIPLWPFLTFGRIG